MNNYFSTNTTTGTTTSSSYKIDTVDSSNYCHDNNVGWVSFDPLTGILKHEPAKTISLLPDAVFFQDDKETVVLKKGNKAHVVSNHDDEYDRVYGFLLAFFQMNSGLSKNKANKYLESLRLVPKQEVKK